MDLLSEEKIQDKSQSEFIMDYDKNTFSNSNVNKAKKEFYLNSCKDYSEFRQSYNNATLKNISINFGFPNTRNTYKYKNPFPLTDIPLFEQRNVFYYDKNFQLFKNKSVSKYGEKKNKNNTTLSQYLKNRILSPQHKIITSIRKKKFLGDKEVDLKDNSKRNEKEEKDVYELEVINQVLFDEEELDGKYKKINAVGIRELDNEWGEIEQEIFENEKNKKNNLLNSVYVEIEKENGDKQLKIVEISRENREDKKKEPCIKIKYTVEDKICLNGHNESPSDSNYYDKDTKDSGIKSYNYKTNTNSSSNIFSTASIRRNENSSLRKENVSEIILKDNKSTQNIFSSTENEKEKVFLYGTMPSSNKYKQLTDIKQDINLLQDNKINSIKPIAHKFEKEEELSPIPKRHLESYEDRTTKLIDIINEEKERKDKTIEMEDQYFMKEKEKEEIIGNTYKKNFFQENKEQIEKIQNAPIERDKIQISIKKEIKIIKSITKDKEKEENRGFTGRFKSKEKEEKEEPEKKEMIFDRNRIIKEKKIKN